MIWNSRTCSRKTIIFINLLQTAYKLQIKLIKEYHPISCIGVDYFQVDFLVFILLLCLQLFYCAFLFYNTQPITKVCTIIIQYCRRSLQKLGMKKQKNQSPKQLNPDDIIGYCQQNFINIIPNICSNTANKPRTKPTQSQHEKQYLKIIMKQLSIFLQLTIQNCVLTSDPKIKSQSYRILGIFRDYLSRDLEDFQTLISHRNNKSKLPFYEIDCRDFLGRDLVVSIPPQVSLYQDPLLFYNYSTLAQEELFCNMPIFKTRQERVQIIRNHVPFLDPNFIPIIEERFETKSKFSEIQDRMLLIMLSLHQKKDISQFKSIYFPNRHESQIRNRAKNLCAKQMVNPIKTLKQNQYLPLSQQQRRILIKAYSRFGPRWTVISKYYSIRSPEMLQSQYQNCQKLDKLRKSYDITITYPPLRQILQKQSISQIAQNSNNNNANSQHNQAQSIGMDIQEPQQKMQEENQPRYKIINHLTFLYEQI